MLNGYLQQSMLGLGGLSSAYSVCRMCGRPYFVSHSPCVCMLSGLNHGLGNLGLPTREPELEALIDRVIKRKKLLLLCED
jgi:hypothetical protein